MGFSISVYYVFLSFYCDLLDKNRRFFNQNPIFHYFVYFFFPTKKNLFFLEINIKFLAFEKSSGFVRQKNKEILVLALLLSFIKCTGTKTNYP